MKVTNKLARDIVAELRSSLEDSRDTANAIVSLHEQDGTKDAQIAAEALKRVAPDITRDEHVQVASDVLRWYCDGDCLDCDPVFPINCTHN